MPPTPPHTPQTAQTVQVTAVVREFHPPYSAEDVRVLQGRASLELCVCLGFPGFSGAAWPCAVAIVGSEPRGEGVDLGGVRVVEAGPLGGAGALPTGSA